MSWYYFDEDGVMQTDWQKIDGKWYNFDTGGKMRTGWLHDAGCTYYLNPAGDMAIGWKEVDSEWYYFGDSGAAVTDWLLSGGKWFYFDYIDYTMETGSREIDGANYNFNNNRRILVLLNMSQPVIIKYRYFRFLFKLGADSSV